MATPSLSARALLTGLTGQQSTFLEHHDDECLLDDVADAHRQAACINVLQHSLHTSHIGSLCTR